MATEEFYEDFFRVISAHFSVVFSNEEYVLCEINIREIQPREGTDKFTFQGVASALVWFTNGDMDGAFVEFWFTFGSFSDKSVGIDIIDEMEKGDVFRLQYCGFQDR